MSRSIVLASTAFAFTIAALGCSAVETVNPARQKGEPDPQGSGGDGGSGGAPAVIRTVSLRSPWGGPAQNLLVDGDFEMTITIQGGETPSGWIALGAAGQPRYLRGETGGLCKSGLRCGVLEPGVLLYGRGTAAAGVAMTASLMAKPPAGMTCDVIKPTMVGCEEVMFPVKLKAVAKTPAADGWCTYQVSVPKTDRKQCMLIESDLKSGDLALVDAAALLANPQMKSLGSPSEPVSPERAARYQLVAKRVRDLTPFGRPREPIAATRRAE